MGKPHYNSLYQKNLGEVEGGEDRMRDRSGVRRWKCSARCGKQKGGLKVWQKAKSPGDLKTNGNLKRLAKAVVSKAKNTKMDSLDEKVDDA